MMNSLPLHSCSQGHHSHAHSSAPPARLQEVECAPEERETYKDLMQSALDARDHAYVPNSHFQVGAAILSKSGKVYTGCNMETTPYADHAEQVAVARALAAGEKPSDLTALACFGAKQGPIQTEDLNRQTFPCGNCRQALFEINPEMREIEVDGPDDVHVYRIADQLPSAYHRERPARPTPPTPEQADPLLAQALLARSRSYVPRSGMPVGAAVQTADGTIYTGVKVETSSFATQAERMALNEALIAGNSNIVRIAVVAGQDDPIAPQGSTWDAYQALSQIAPQAEVVIPGADGQFVSHPLNQFPTFLSAPGQA